MSWDISQDLQTGDFVWDSKRDLLGAEGLGLIQQRIHRRLMIGRGEFLYDRSGQLGSRIRSLLNMGIPAASGGLEMLIREALTPMTDILVTTVDVFSFGDGSGVVNDPRNVTARIEYELNVSPVDFPSDSSGQFTTDVSIPV